MISKIKRADHITHQNKSPGKTVYAVTSRTLKFYLAPINREQVEDFYFELKELTGGAFL